MIAETTLHHIPLSEIFPICSGFALYNFHAGFIMAYMWECEMDTSAKSRPGYLLSFMPSSRPELCSYIIKRKKILTSFCFKQPARYRCPQRWILQMDNVVCRVKRPPWTLKVNISSHRSLRILDQPTHITECPHRLPYKGAHTEVKSYYLLGYNLNGLLQYRKHLLQRRERSAHDT